jgi:hypothetical protein
MQDPATENKPFTAPLPATRNNLVSALARGDLVRRGCHHTANRLHNAVTLAFMVRRCHDRKSMKLLIRKLPFHPLARKFTQDIKVHIYIRIAFKLLSLLIIIFRLTLTFHQLPTLLSELDPLRRHQTC